VGRRGVAGTVLVHKIAGKPGVAGGALRGGSGVQNRAAVAAPSSCRIPITATVPVQPSVHIRSTAWLALSPSLHQLAALLGLPPNPLPAGATAAAGASLAEVKAAAEAAAANVGTMGASLTGCTLFGQPLADRWGGPGAEGSRACTTAAFGVRC